MPSQSADAGAWIRAEMEGVELSTKAVSGVSGVSRRTIYAQMQNPHSPTTHTQRGPAIGVQANPDWCDRLMRGEEPADATAGGSGDLEGHVAALKARVDALAAIQATDDQFTASALDGGKPTAAEILAQTLTGPQPAAEDDPHLED